MKADIKVNLLRMVIKYQGIIIQLDGTDIKHQV